MRWRPLTWLLLSLMFFLGAIYFWRLGDEWEAKRRTIQNPRNSTIAPHQSDKISQPAKQTQVVPVSRSGEPGNLNSPAVGLSPKPDPSARYPHRLSNTSKTVGELAKSDKAILLENALFDTEVKVTLPIPDQLRSKADPGSYIIQSRSALDAAFRAKLQSLGANIVSYIPNNAYLVRASAAIAQQLEADPRTQTVLPYEPYYKLKPGLLGLAVNQQPLPDNAALNLVVFPDAREQTLTALQGQGVEILGETRSPFGPLLQVRPPSDGLSAVASLPGVQVVELLRKRVSANDLSRVAIGVSADTATAGNYLGLSGKDVIVNVNDTGVDATHPDLAPRVFSDTAASSTDKDGHGTHVAGIIAGSGLQSTTVSNAQGSVMPGQAGQFRGMAPEARIFSMLADLQFGPVGSDAYLQETAWQKRAQISNNSWHYFDDSDYDLSAASYDAAVRDAIPGLPGSQSLLFVFAAGNAGNGADDGAGGVPDTILSPATAKNVLTVGAIEQPRNITNDVSKCTTVDGIETCETNQVWLAETDSSDQVAGFSSRGNVGVGIEGDFGRFKPDVVAPGVFVISTRSTQWDTAAYYDPTSHVFQVFRGLVAPTNQLWANSLFVQDNTVGANIDIIPNGDSPFPFPDLPIYVKQSDIPTTVNSDFIRTNHVSIPPDGPPPLIDHRGVDWFYAVGNNTGLPVPFDLRTDLTVTNEQGDYFQVLSNMNDSLGGFYRYESGTSMAAGDVSGTLALIQDFFQRQNVTNSPALMKALIINGARSVGVLYNLQVQKLVNEQGWGLIHLPNSIPLGLTNISGNSPPQQAPMYIFDQSPSGALATGQSQTRYFQLNPLAQAQPLRATLVWTDPPGNPVASLKLVNNLDLIVTNLDTGDVFFGNDILAGNDSNVAWDTNGLPNLDFVNNVENVFLSAPPGAPLGTNYSVTVLGRRVNVNAVTAQTNDVVQDYALVISSGDGGVPDALTYTNQPAPVSLISAFVTYVTNSFTASVHDVGGILLAQHVGASSPLLGLNYVPLSGTARITIGVTNQWHFYVMTNENLNGQFTNAAFLTFLPPELALPRMGVRAANVNEDSPDESDLELYVSKNSDLTNLVPAVLSSASKSLIRGGTQQVVITNATTGVYYIAVKAEFQEAAEYGFLGVFSDLPFNSTDAAGNQTLRGFPTPVALPDGTAQKPNGAYLFAIATDPSTVRRVIVTNAISHQLMGDLQGTLGHQRRSAVLNNHSPNSAVTNAVYVYDDSDEQDVKDLSGNPARHTDGPSSLQTFGGQQGVGQWMLTMVDNAPQHVGTNLSFTVFLERQQDLSNGVSATILPGACRDDFIYVPIEATNLTVSVSIQNGGPGVGPLLMTVCPEGASGDDCKARLIVGNGGSITISKFSLPPLNAGLYVIRLCNQGSGPVKVLIKATLGLDFNGIVPSKFPSAPTFIQDDSVTYSTQFINSTQKIASVDVGVRIDHPRISDLALTLISPSGKRILLFENRGGTTPDGMGSGALVTNVYPTVDAGFAKAQTNILDVGVNQGLLIINYQFYDIPDFMHIYYDGALIYDTGNINGSGQFSLNFGPGISTNVVIIMNEGDNPQQDTKWTYTATVVNPAGFSYLVFTENTNLTTTPIKFAIPPFGSTNAPTTVAISDFEVNPGEYFAPGTVDQWQLGTNQVTVLRDPDVVPPSGSNVLALASASISRTLPTTSGTSYSLNYAYRGPDIVSFWRGENNADDSLGLNNGLLMNGASFGAGEVDAGFLLDGVSQHVRIADAPNLRLTNALTLDAWILPTRFGPGANAILSKFDAPALGSTQRAYSLACTSSGQLYLTVSPDGLLPQTVSVTSPGSLSPNQWSHVAGTYDGNSLKVYINGTLVNQVAYSAGIFAGTNDFSIGAVVGGYAVGAGDSFWAGGIDEASVYRRALSASEIKAIYTAGKAGKFARSTTIPDALSEARVTLGGITTNLVFGNNYSWQAHPINFKATQNGTPLRIDGLEPGLLLDSFSLSGVASGGIYYLPEESLSAVVGDIAYGQWQLEILDTRVGATNFLPILEAWQLSFTFATSTPKVIELTTGFPATNTIPPGGIAYFSVDVPTWASYATNVLLFADGPVNLLFNQQNPPQPTDFKLLTGVKSGIGSPILSTNSVPPLVRDSTYYLGIENTTTSNVTAVIEVDFDITPLFDRVPVTNQTAATALPRYFYFDVSSNATAVSFQLFNLSGNLDLVARNGLPPPAQGDADYGSFNPGTNDESIIIFTNSSPVPLSSGRWYLSVLNADLGADKYTILATEYTNPIPVIHRLFNKVAFANTNAGGADNLDYYVYTVSPNAGAVQFEVDNPTADVTLIGRKGLPLPVPGSFDFQSANPGTANEFVVLTKGSSPPVTPGDWFLTVVNLSGGPVTYSIMATELPPPVINTNLVITNWFASSNSFCLSWTSVPGVDYFVQGRADLVSPWAIVSPAITATGAVTTFCVPLPSQYHFFQVLQGAATNPNPVVTLTNGLPATNTIAAGQIGYFVIDVPAWANYATNILNFADAPVNLLFNQLNPPGTNDFKLLTAVRRGVGSPILSSNSAPALVRGSSYYLGVQNTSSSNITAAIEVDFDITPLSNGVPVAGKMTASSQPRYFYYDVTTNGTAVSFQLLKLTGDLNLVAGKGFPLPTVNNTLYSSLNPGTNDESIIIFTNSSPVALSSGRWYLGVVNGDLAADNFTILATEYTNPIPVIQTLFNRVLIANTNAGGANNTDYYRYTVSPNAQSVQFEVDNPTANVTLVGRKGLPLPSLASFDFQSANPGTANELVLLNQGSTPPITPGDWFLAVVNVSGGPASYSIMATEIASVINTNVVITNWFLSSNSFCLTWTSIAGTEYFVQGKTNLSGPWVAVSPAITASGPLTTFCIPLPSPYHFFQVLQGSTTNAGSGVTITTITRTASGIQIQWTAAPGAVFRVQWTPSLSPPNWTSFPGTVTSNTSNFSFLDDGSQSGGLNGPRFYRLLQVSP